MAHQAGRDEGETERQGRSVAAHVREVQRAVAEREAARLARPELRMAMLLPHADRLKAAVSSTPFGVLTRNPNSITLSQEWCGPFSVARQMIARREEARIRRLRGEVFELSHPLDEALAQHEEERKRKEHPSLTWKGRPQINDPETLYAKRQRRAEAMWEETIPSLFDLCVNFLVDNFEHVQSLGDVDASIRTAISHALVAAGKMNEASFKAIAEVGTETLEVSDCCHISERQLAATLQELLPAGLRYLVLDQAGRCFGPKVVEAIVAAAKDSQITAMSIGGAHLFSDADCACLVEACRFTVNSFEFKACPLIGPLFCQSLVTSYAGKDTLLVELALEDVPITEAQIKSLGTCALRNVKSLSLRRLEGLNDDAVAILLEATGDRLEALDLSVNYNLTDASLSAIRRFSTRIQDLTLSGLRHCTAAGLEALFTFVPGMAEPPMLRALDVSQCDHEAVTDQVIDLATQASTKKYNAEQTASLGGLVKLDMQGSAVVTDAAMECIAANCTTTLQELNVSFCGRITDRGLGYLVDKVGNQLSKVHIWGCAQITDEFLDGHCRATDPTLDVCGAWMKKAHDIFFL